MVEIDNLVKDTKLEAIKIDPIELHVVIESLYISPICQLMIIHFLFTAISAIPKIVCETIHALELHDETPSWKIMDNKGRVTVVLHWDQRSSSSSQVQQQQGKPGQDAQTSKYSPTKKADLSSAQRPSLVIQTSLDKLGYDGKAGHLPGEIGPPRYTSPRITVINHDDMVFNYGFTSLSASFRF